MAAARGGESGQRWALAAIARRQHGVVARRQLLGAGLSARQIEGRLERGDLLRMPYRGVYAVGHAGRGPIPGAMAAVLACEEGTVLSHLSAAALWQLCDWPEQHEVIPTLGTTRGPRGVQVHRAESLREDEHVKLEEVPVTTVARTLLDIAATRDRQLLERIYEAADRRRLIRHPQIGRLLSRSRYRKGAAVLRRFYASRDPDALPTRSELERRALRLVTDAGLPAPRTNVHIAGREVDMIWDEQRVMVELDGHRHHSGEASFNSDRARDLMMASLGYQVVRLTWAMLRDEPARTTQMLSEILERERTGPA